MSHYSVLNEVDILEIIKEYGIETLDSYTLLSGGSENTNYLIASEKRKFVLTICEQKTSKNAKELTYLLEYLAKHGFETSKVLRTIAGEPIAYWQEKPVMLKIFLEGNILEILPSHTLEKIGSEMGRLHQIEAPSYLPKVLSYGEEYFHEVSTYAASSSFEIWLKEIKNYIEPLLSIDLPKSLIHSDIFYSNIVVSKDGSQVSIMDFEEAANYYRIFDVGMTIVGLCTEGEKVNLKEAGYLMKGYQREIQLTEKEKLALQAFTVYAASAMTFWRHQNFNHSNPDPEMYDHYLGLKVIADYVRKIPTIAFLEILK
jgi:homoserine kinase type II